MDFTVGYILSSKQRFNICVCVLVAALVMCVSSKPTRGDNSQIHDTKLEALGQRTDFKTFFNSYILPRLRLEQDLDSSEDFLDEDSDIEQQLQDKINFDNLENNDYQENSRIKRKSFAGMGNFDIMTATLDRQKAQRRPMMMSVSRLNMNRLQNLMRQQGRRRK